MPVEPWREPLEKIVANQIQQRIFENNISKKQNEQWMESICIL